MRAGAGQRERSLGVQSASSRECPASRPRSSGVFTCVAGHLWTSVQAFAYADPDIVAARSAARELAVRAGFSGADLTMLATAVSEVARNIVRFASTGEVTVELLDRPRPGIRVVARDTGPGIADVGRALEDGYSTCQGLGLGLPGARRLMDEFNIVSEPGHGTTVSMTKWFDTKGRG
nr:anti-sigma regulatory factor [Pedococcus badiiscoriae]